MKIQPFSDIIDLNEERKEYALFCKGKSEKFALFSEWESHIKSMLANIGSSEDLYNLKHYCIIAARVEEKAPEMYVAYIGLLLSLYLSTILDGLPMFLAFVLTAGVLIYAISHNKALALESGFYKDLIAIIESTEQEVQ